MPRGQPVVVLVPRDSRAHHALRDDPPPSVAGGAVVVTPVTPVGDTSRIEPPATGTVVFSLPSPEVLLRDADDVRRAVDLAPPGAEPVVVLLAAADALREEHLALLVEAGARAPSALVVAVLGPG
jgi:hypothetical protein